MGSHVNECHEPWDWASADAFSLTATTAPPGVSCSLWDEFSHINEVDSGPCDSTPPGDTRQYTLGASSTTAASEVDVNTVISQLDTRCFKRRRMLLFSNSDQSVSDEAFKNIVQTFQACKDPFEDFVEPDATLTSSFWLNAHDHLILNPVEDEVSAGFSDCWMDGCGIQDSHGDDEFPDADIVHTTSIPITEMPGEVLQPCLSWENQPDNHDSTQVRETIDHRSPSCESEGATQTRTRLGARNSKLVYPFALVKPCGVHGDATLQDINKQILMGVSNSANINSNMKPHKHGQLSRRSSSTGSPSSGTSPSSQVEPEETESLFGREMRGQSFSGKSVMALTKIHTYGNGTITIRRTRG